MTDNTNPLVELRAAYRTYQNAKRDKKDEIIDKYWDIMRAEIRDAIEEEANKFAALLKSHKAKYNLRIGDIQDEVFRTRSWKTWTEWRERGENQ